MSEHLKPANLVVVERRIHGMTENREKTPYFPNRRMEDAINGFGRETFAEMTLYLALNLVTLDLWQLFRAKIYRRNFYVVEWRQEGSSN